MSRKISIRFYNDREVRAVWDEIKNIWRFSVIDIIGVLCDEDDYEKNRNYWKYLKAKLKKEGSKLGSITTQFKLQSRDGKKRFSNVFTDFQIIELAKQFPSKKANRFIEWFINSEETLDGKSKRKAYALWQSSFIDAIEVGTIKGLKQIHAYLFGGLYDFAGQIRTKNIAKSDFKFALFQYLDKVLDNIEKMPEESFEEIIDKYVELNIAHPFMEGNGRSMRIWLDMILKKHLKKCIDWSKINKKEYLDAMRKSVINSSKIKNLFFNALTEKIYDREIFMKGIDYSYYYEED